MSRNYSSISGYKLNRERERFGAAMQQIRNLIEKVSDWQATYLQFKRIEHTAKFQNIHVDERLNIAAQLFYDGVNYLNALLTETEFTALSKIKETDFFNCLAASQQLSAEAKQTGNGNILGLFETLIKNLSPEGYYFKESGFSLIKNIKDTGWSTRITQDLIWLAQYLVKLDTIEKNHPAPLITLEDDPSNSSLTAFPAGAVLHTESLGQCTGLSWFAGISDITITSWNGGHPVSSLFRAKSVESSHSSSSSSEGKDSGDDSDNSSDSSYSGSDGSDSEDDSEVENSKKSLQ